MRLTTIALGLLCLAAPGTAACTRATTSGSTPPSKSTPSLITVAAPVDPLAGIDADVKAIMDAYAVPGLSMVVVHDHKVIFSQGYGFIELGKPDRVDPDTVFAIASNTKAFVATSVGMLVEEGVIGWDDRVSDHLPDLRLWDEYTTSHIRVRDLLCHRSGLATWAGDVAWIGSDITNEQLLGRLRHVPAGHDFRERFGYTNLMFVVAGELLRVKTGQPWDEVVRRRILEPLAMQRTTTTVKALPSMDNVATPHMDIAGEAKTIDYLDLDNAGAAGALNSSVNDLSRWLIAQLDEGRYKGTQVIPAGVLSETRRPHTPIPRPIPKNGPKTGHFSAYGLGWFLVDRHGAFVVTHSGGLPGMLSRVTLLPDAGLGVAVLTNSESAAATHVANIVVDRFLGVEGAAEVELAQRKAAKKAEADQAQGPVETRPATVPAARLAGRYRHPLLGRALVEVQDGAARLEVTDHGDLACPLTHEDEDTYTCTWEDPIFGRSHVSFDVDRGKVSSLRFRVRPEFVDPLEYRFTRGR